MLRGLSERGKRERNGWLKLHLQSCLDREVEVVTVKGSSRTRRSGRKKRKGRSSRGQHLKVMNFSALLVTQIVGISRNKT